MTFIQFLVYFGAINGVILCSLLFYTKKNSKAALWMGLFVAVNSLNTINYTVVKDLYFSTEWFTLVRVPTLYASGLLIWMYVQHLIHKDFKLGKQHFWLLLPFIADALYSLLRAAYIYFFALDRKAELFHIPIEHLIHEGGAIAYNIALYIMAFYAIRKHNISVQNNLSFTENVSLKWLQLLFILILIPHVIWVGLYFVEIYMFPDFLPFSAYYPLWTYVIIASMVVGYRSLLQPQIDYSQIQVLDSKQKDKYQSSGLSDADLKNHGSRLIQIVEEQQLYLIPNLKLADLSEKTGLSNHQLSQIISESLSTNFYDFINRYRVEEVKERLRQGQADQYSLISIAFDSGFNSKTAFYTAFKKYTNKTPSKYLSTLNH